MNRTNGTININVYSIQKHLKPGRGRAKLFLLEDDRMPCEWLQLIGWKVPTSNGNGEMLVGTVIEHGQPPLGGCEPSHGHTYVLGLAGRKITNTWNAPRYRVVGK